MFPGYSKRRSIAPRKKVCSPGSGVFRSKRRESVLEGHGHSSDTQIRGYRVKALCFVGGKTKMDMFIHGITHRHHRKSTKRAYVKGEGHQAGSGINSYN